ncbi:transcription initiation factor TFIID subunit 4B isoform X1 [Chelonia mydas]|uniref:transcription initiation factor TFIID subunit 4B isoform X1 n=1 Tax=Chelonia mydas TaxID=8469 RepID=UPI0018A2241E|nr:transcription initiation factor TFIID subunit 4B isoform X1 [Chelonia mydas]
MSTSAAAPVRVMPAGHPEQAVAAPAASGAGGAQPAPALLCSQSTVPPASVSAAGAPAGAQAVALSHAVTKVPISLVPAVSQQSRVVAAPVGTLVAKVATVTAAQQPPKNSGGPRLAAPQTVAPKAPQTTTIQLPANFQIPPGTVLIRSNSGQLMLVSQQAIARAQSQSQNNTGARPSIPTSTPSVRICTVQNTGTHLVKKVVTPPLKTVSQATNSVASTDQRPAIVQPAAATNSVTTVTAVKPPGTGTPVKLPVTGPPAPSVSQKPISVKEEGTTVAQPNTSTEMLENVKKCKNFLATLIKLASSGPQAPEMGQNVKNLVQHLLEAKIEPEEFTKKLYVELKSSPQPYLVPFLKKSMLALRQLMPNAQSFIQQCIQQQATTQAAVSTCVSAAPTSSTVVTTSALAKTSVQPIKPVPASAVVTGSQTVKPVPSTLVTAAAASLQTVKPVTAPLHPANPVPTSAVATTSLQAVKPVFASAVATTTTTPLQPVKSVIGTPISIKITQPNSIVAQSVHAQQTVRVKQLVVQQPSGGIVKQVATLPQTATLTLQKPGEKRMPLNALIQTNQFPAGSFLKQITLPGNKILSLQASPVQKNKIKENGTTSFRDEDDINDVTSMAGVNLSEENACILATNSEVVGTLIRSCADEPFLSSEALQKKILDIGKRHDIMEPNSDVVNLISHATQERLRGLLEKLTVIAQHRMTTYKESNKYIISSDTRAQLRFLEKLDHMEKQRKDEEEREMLLRAAKSRSNKEDPEQLRLKQKAKEMQQLELAQMQQREANLTALAAIGPRKKRPLDSPNLGSGLEGLNGTAVASGSSGVSLTKQLFRPRITRVCLRDLIFCMEQEREMKRSLALYRALLK